MIKMCTDMNLTRSHVLFLFFGGGPCAGQLHVQQVSATVFCIQHVLLGPCAGQQNCPRMALKENPDNKVQGAAPCSLLPKHSGAPGKLNSACALRQARTPKGAVLLAVVWPCLLCKGDRHGNHCPFQANKSPRLLKLTASSQASLKECVGTRFLAET